MRALVLSLLLGLATVGAVVLAAQLRLWWHRRRDRVWERPL